ncbi:MAG: hypothetical protein JW800_05920 [Candidatus Omnitrophica bacterium]|nr:hypothetical protein [Candidatus Omnitrophota bacterium]
MKRALIFLLLVAISLAFICEMVDRKAGAQETIDNDIEKILDNQKQILKRIDDLDNKLDVIKMRIRM